MNKKSLINLLLKNKKKKYKKFNLNRVKKLINKLKI